MELWKFAILRIESVLLLLNITVKLIKAETQKNDLCACLREMPSVIRFIENN